MYRLISIVQICVMFVRRYWIVAASGTLSLLFRFVYACMSVVSADWQNFQTARAKQRILALIPPCIGPVQKYLQNTYDKGISIGYKGFEESDTLWMSNNINNNDIWLSNDISTNTVWLSNSIGATISSQVLTVTVQASFAANVEQFNAMKADLNVIRLSGTRLNIKIAQ